MVKRSLSFWGSLIGLAALLNIAALPGPVAAGAAPISGVPEWIPLDDAVVLQEFFTPPPTLLLPDLHTLPPTDLHLEIFRGEGIIRLRFSNTIWNSGPGDLELRAAPFPLPGAVHVTQYIYRGDGSIEFHEAGLFDFHDVHGHWHWDDFSLYEIWSVTPVGTLNERVAASDKVGYCLIDVDPFEKITGEPAGFPLNAPQFTGCIWTRQGLTTGWTDSYKSHIGGQYVDISHLPNGVYALKSTVNPDGIIQEMSRGNNSAIIYFAFEGDKITVLGERYIRPAVEHTPR